MYMCLFPYFHKRGGVFPSSERYALSEFSASGLSSHIALDIAIKTFVHIFYKYVYVTTSLLSMNWDYVAEN